MVSDQEPRYRLVDANGNIVGSLYGKADGSVAIQETDSGSDREVALAPDGTFSAPSVETDSVSTEELVTDGRTVLKFVEGIDAGSDTNQIQFDGLSDGQSYGIFVSRYQGADNLLMTFNENVSTDQYAYWDESGTKITSDNIELVDCTFPRLSGWIEVGSRPDGQFYGFDNRLRFGRPSNVDGFAQKGGAEADELDSIELFVDNDAEFSSDDRVELFEVI